ncbi:uncharacterized protein CDAR_255111 [Caerostris darwini]|uniref:Uncharacterized protein n=1 Tax=Caerostris darwini TaxID=1538125 RepID=A0AAV4VAK1_9ARAC|nr:uncharacterized protein CDAR_255111 [Caerostris darwini]
MNTLGLFILFLATSVALSSALQKANSTAQPAASDKVTAKSARSEYHHGHHGGFEHHFPHFHGGHHLGGYGHHKEFDHYLIPLLVVLGLGVLVMPLLSVFMTTLVGNVPVTTLVSGRKKREVPGVEDVEEKITEIFKRFGRAFEAFNQDSKED